MLDVIFLIRERIAHAKPRQEYGVESLRSERGRIFDYFPKLRDARMCFCSWKLR